MSSPHIEETLNGTTKFPSGAGNGELLRGVSAFDARLLIVAHPGGPEPHNNSEDRVQKQTLLTGIPKYRRHLVASTLYVTVPHKNVTAHNARLAICLGHSHTTVERFQQFSVLNSPIGNWAPVDNARG